MLDLEKFETINTFTLKGKDRQIRDLAVNQD